MLASIHSPLHPTLISSDHVGTSLTQYFGGGFHSPCNPPCTQEHMREEYFWSSSQLGATCPTGGIVRRDC